MIKSIIINKTKQSIIKLTQKRENEIMKEKGVVGLGKSVSLCLGAIKQGGFHDLNFGVKPIGNLEMEDGMQFGTKSRSYKIFLHIIYRSINHVPFRVIHLPL